MIASAEDPLILSFSPRGEGTLFRSLSVEQLRSAQPECRAQELARRLQALGIDAVAEPWPDMPLDRNAGGGERHPGVMDRLDGDDIVAGAVDQEHGRLAFDFGGETRRAREVPGKPHDGGRRFRSGGGPFAAPSWFPG